MLYTRLWMRLSTCPSCTACGASTVHRPGVSLDDGSRATPSYAQSAVQLTRRACELTKRSDVRVLVSDVHIGVARAVVDPHGTRWRAYAPLVPLCDDSGVVVEEDGRVVTSGAGWVRTAFCYVENDAPVEEVAALGRALSAMFV